MVKKCGMSDIAHTLVYKLHFLKCSGPSRIAKSDKGVVKVIA